MTTLKTTLRGSDLGDLGPNLLDSPVASGLRRPLWSTSRLGCGLSPQPSVSGIVWSGLSCPVLILLFQSTKRTGTFKFDL